jgi:esterase/lipase superfamily enzyme
MLVGLVALGCDRLDDRAPPPQDQAAHEGPDERPRTVTPDVRDPANVETVIDEPWARVRVFYATDRVPIESSNYLAGFLRYWPTWGSAALTILFVGLTFFSSRRVLFGVVTVVCLLVTVVLGYQAALEASRQVRTLSQGQIYYGYDRRPSDGEQVLDWGVCEVTLPPDHRVGRLESPSILRLEFVEDPRKHVMLQTVVRLEPDAFFEQLDRRIDQSERQEALVFIHGYNVGFDKAVRRTAQIALDLRFDGAPICYTWPSKEAIPAYTHDEANVEWTVSHLERFLTQLVERSAAQHVHIIAHSMGNRALVSALDMIARDRPQEDPMFGQIVLAAPDVDAEVFKDRYADTVTSMARQVTLYASSYDKALIASMEVHGYPRAGMSGENMVVLPGVDTIDASPIDTSLIGHSYYGNNPIMIQDLRALIELGEPASAREWLEQVTRQARLAHWCFREEFLLDE